MKQLTHGRGQLTAWGLFVALSVSCGARTDLPGAGGPSDGDAAPDAAWDAAGGSGGVDATRDALSPDGCSPLELRVDTQESCSISLAPSAAPLLEGFLDVDGQLARVLVADRWENGRLLAWCDNTTLGALLDEWNALSWLGRSTAPRVASFGDGYTCNPGSGAFPLPAGTRYFGRSVPAEYANAASLAAEFDVVLACAFRDWDIDAGTTAALASFVSDFGGGLLVSTDYLGVSTPADFAKASSLVAPRGLTFDAIRLGWGPMTAHSDCL